MSVLLGQLGLLCAGLMCPFLTVGYMHAAGEDVERYTGHEAFSRSGAGAQKRINTHRRSQAPTAAEIDVLDGCGDEEATRNYCIPTAGHFRKLLTEIERAEAVAAGGSIKKKNHRLRGAGRRQPAQITTLVESKGEETTSRARKPPERQMQVYPSIASAAGTSVDCNLHTKGDKKEKRQKREGTIRRDRKLQIIGPNSLGISPQNAENYVFFYGVTRANDNLGLSAANPPRTGLLLPPLPGGRPNTEGFLTPYTTNPYYTVSLNDPNY